MLYIHIYTYIYTAAKQVLLRADGQKDNNILTSHYYMSINYKITVKKIRGLLSSEKSKPDIQRPFATNLAIYTHTHIYIC